MNKILIALLVIVIAAAGIFLATSSSDDSDGTDTQASDQAGLEAPAPVEPSQTAEDSEQMFSKDDVLHATETDCWTYVRDSVYDITSYIPRHPGGDEILRACGTDGTSLFESRTTTEGEQVGSGAPHSPDAAVLLADLRIGALAN